MHDLPVYVQNPPIPIHLRDEILVELWLMQIYGIVTILSNSEYSNPIFSQRKPSWKLRSFIHLRRVIHLPGNDYSNNKFPISNTTDAVYHFAGKTLFPNLDYSQAYHCVQMADPLSEQLLSFNFASRTNTYTRLAPGPNKSVTRFSSFVRPYLDSCRKRIYTIYGGYRMWTGHIWTNGRGNEPTFWLLRKISIKIDTS